MNTSMIQVDQELWEAWISFDHDSSSGFGTLYVLGEAPVEGKSFRPVLLRNENQADPRVLELHLPQLRGMGRIRMKEVSYSEPVGQIGQYHTICIFQGEDLLLEIRDIEVLI